MGLRVLLNLGADRAAERIEDQHLGAGGDIRLGIGQLRRLIAVGVIDLELRRRVAGRGEGLGQIRLIEGRVAGRRRRIGKDDTDQATTCVM